MGLVIYNSIALYVRGAKQGKLVETTDPNDEDFQLNDSDDNTDRATVAQWLLDEEEICHQGDDEQQEANTLIHGLHAAVSSTDGDELPQDYFIDDDPYFWEADNPLHRHSPHTTALGSSAYTWFNPSVAI